MNFRKVVSLFIGMLFLGLVVTGILEYVWSFTHWVATLHTVFGGLFLVGVGFHIYNNSTALKHYFLSKELVAIIIGMCILLAGGYRGWFPFSTVMEWGTRIRAQQKQEVNKGSIETVKILTGRKVPLELDIQVGKYYWHPQMAIWIESVDGTFVESLYVSKATAKGLFFGGRTKDNFKQNDGIAKEENSFRRVNALPVWSHSRGVQYNDGYWVPPAENPLPDAVTGATIGGNTVLKTSVDSMPSFKLFLEINVAFDDNAYFSEYDFPEDETYHSGTGQLGQPSLIYALQIAPHERKQYQLMQLIGHGHHSAKDGVIYQDMSVLTTALEIIERIVVRVN